MSKKEYIYRDLVGRLAQVINAELLGLEAIYNFDIGDEFELAMCRILRKALPSKYGVCRGHAITTDNQTAGDDIIIYDREGSPTLRMLPTEDFSRKEFIPIDAVYAYIEAKHTLYLDGRSNQSIIKAAKQVEAVKALPREPRTHYKITDNFTLSPGGLLELEVGGLEHPEISNPLLGCIFARHVAWKRKRRPPSELPDRPDIRFGMTPELQPDIIVAGNDMIGLPVNPDAEGNEKRLLLFRDGKPSNLHLFITEERALALGIICLLHALDTIRLNKIDWKPIITEQLTRTR